MDIFGLSYLIYMPGCILLTVRQENYFLLFGALSSFTLALEVKPQNCKTNVKAFCDAP